MESIEELDELLVVNFSVVKQDVSYLDVTSIRRANFAVSRVGTSGRIRVHEADRSSKDSTGVLFSEFSCVELFCAPVAAGTKSSQLFTVLRIIVPISWIATSRLRRPWLARAVVEEAS